MSLIPGYDEQNPAGINLAFHYVLINRDGPSFEFAEEFSGGIFADAIPNGAIFAYTPNPNGSRELDPTEIYLLNSDGSLRYFTEIVVDYSLGWSPPQLVWTSASTIPSDLSPFAGQ